MIKPFGRLKGDRQTTFFSNDNIDISFNMYVGFTACQPLLGYLITKSDNES